MRPRVDATYRLTMFGAAEVAAVTRRSSARITPCPRRGVSAIELPERATGRPAAVADQQRANLVAAIARRPRSPARARAPAHSCIDIAGNSMDRIFISYRRSDAGGYARNLVNDLQRRFGNQIFQDVERSLPGDRFRSRIARVLARCDVVVVVIGPDWLTRDEHGKRRIDDPEDVLRQEIATAVRRDDVAVLPVLVGGAPQPRMADLPLDLQPLLQSTTYRLDEGIQRRGQLEFLARTIRGYTDARRALPAALAALAAVALMLSPAREAATGLWDDWTRPDDEALQMLRLGALHALEWALLCAAASAGATLACAGPGRALRATAKGALAGAVGGLVGGAIDQGLRATDESLALVVGVTITASIAATGGLIGRPSARAVVAAALGALVGALLTLTGDDMFWDYGLPALTTILAVCLVRLSAARSAGALRVVPRRFHATTGARGLGSSGP
jgi:hypothetical protein